MLPCCWPRSGGSYVRLQVEDSCSSDSEEELELVCVDGSQTTEQNDNIDEITSSAGSSDEVDGATTTSAQSSSPSGWSLTDAEAGALTRAGFAILRVCDYIQLALKRPSLLLHRGGRSVDGNSTVPIYTASNGANHSYFVNGTEIPQWIYPCGVTPNGTFPDGHRPFRIYDPNVDDYIQPEFLDYGMYFSGGYNNLSHTISRGWWGEALITEPFSEKWHTLPYGFRGKGDWIPVHFGDHTPQYPFASVGISNQLSYDGGTCPKWIFNATHFFGGGYLGWEEPGFDPIYPCGIRPDGLFTNAWVGFANGSVPNNTYPFGHFPNNNFPYLDYFFNPGFNHPELYLAVLNNRTEALSNFTSFLNASETGRLYHPIPRNSSDEFAPCFGIYDYQSLYAPQTSPVPVTSQNTSTATTHHSLTTHAVDPSSVDRALIQAGLWSAQLGAELAVVLTQGDSCARRRIAQALYLGARTANILHSAVDLVSNVSHIIENGHTDEHGELAIRNMLTLTDIFSLVSDAAYFCAPAIQQAQEQLSNGTVSGYFQSACSLMSRAGRAARRAVNTVAGAVGAAGVACAAGMSAALTAEFINNDDTDSTGQRVILGMQIAVAAAATTALGCLASKYIRRACGSSSSESQS